MSIVPTASQSVDGGRLWTRSAVDLEDHDTTMTQRKPNLFVIGAMKSGTTYLRKLLNAHPDIFMCDPDEPSYFVDPRDLKTIYPIMWKAGLWRSEARYLHLFEAAGNARVLGEASTSYTKLPHAPGTAERIAAFNPKARFIYLVRDPVERAISHYWHMVRYHTECRPIAKAFRRDRQFAAYSDYAMQLRPYQDRFGRDRILVLVHERLVTDPVGVMRSVYEWLGVSASVTEVSRFAEPENVTPEVISMVRWAGIPRRLHQTPAMRSAIEWIPPAVHRALHCLTAREVRRRAIDMMEAVAFLRSQQLERTDELARLLDCSFPEWTTLYGASPIPTPLQGRPSTQPERPPKTIIA